MTKKTYISNSNVSVRVSLSNGSSALITFEPQVGGGSVFETTDTTLQGGLENHSKYGKLFKLKSSETTGQARTYPKATYYDKESSMGNVLTFSHQNLTEQERQQARENIGASASPEENLNVIRYSEQVLTDVQKGQARNNINAEEYAEIISENEIDSVLQ